MDRKTIELRWKEFAFGKEGKDSEVVDFAARIAEEVKEEDAQAIPTSWLDPMLTGPEALLGRPPYGCPDIERLLNGIRAAVRGRTGGEE